MCEISQVPGLSTEWEKSWVTGSWLKKHLGFVLTQDKPIAQDSQDVLKRTSLIHPRISSDGHFGFGQALALILDLYDHMRYYGQLSVPVNLDKSYMTILLI